jgi:starch synthase
MAASVPVVATRVGGVPELLADGGEGLLVPGLPAPLAGAEAAAAAPPVARLAEALARLLARPVLGEAMGRRGRERAEREFSLAAVAGRYRGLYETVLAGAPRPRPVAATT